MAALPVEKLTECPRPFTFTGMDYFGPFEVTIGRRHEKRYGVIFTCLSVRAVHLEIADSLTTDSAIMAVRRFISRRGAPKTLWSDNGTNLRGADTELKKALTILDQTTLTAEMTSHGIDWKFIPPSSPHMGGSWERLVGSVKKAIMSILKEDHPREEVLRTVFAEAEFSVNSRPLTHVSSGVMDLHCITPNNFLIGPKTDVFSPGSFDRNDLIGTQWRRSQALAEMFWNRWTKEYLPTLQPRTKWNKDGRPIQVGDICVVADNTMYTNKRNQWPLGRIEKVFSGKDGIIRVVHVRTVKGVFKRPVVKICPIIQDEKSSDDQVFKFSDTVPKPGGLCHRQNCKPQSPEKVK